MHARIVLWNQTGSAVEAALAAIARCHTSIAARAAPTSISFNFRAQNVIVELARDYGFAVSGIAGIVLLDDGLDGAVLIRKLTTAMTRRGPDARGHWTSRNVSLGHCMLRTTPESVNESQPLSSRDARFTIVFDGRLDNIAELRRTLASDSLLPDGAADAEFALAAYRRWGDESVARLLGDFAFAIWDDVEQSIFCARDPFGVKPFYYSCNRRLFAFASDHEALLQLPSVSAAVNEDRIAALLVPSFNAFDPSISWLADVRKLEPGHCMRVFADGRSVTQQYWNPQAPPVLVLQDEREYVDAFHEVFVEAVGCRMRSQHAPALMLSGGVDSGSIAAATRDARNVRWPAVRAMSMVARQGDACEESRNIRLVCESLGIPGTMLSVDELNSGALDAILNRELWAASHPVRHSLPLPLLLYEMAERTGHRVLLDGIEGDLVTYAPSHYLVALLRRFEIGQAWTEATLAQRFHTRWSGVGRERIFLVSLLRALVPASAIMWRRRLRAKQTVSIPAWVSPGFVQRVRLRERLTQQFTDYSGDTAEDSVAQRLRILASAPGLRVGHEGMALVADRFAVEPRHPWSDVRLANFFLSLPLNRRVRDGWTKHLVRTWTAQRVAPSAVWHSGKAHLGWHVISRAMKGPNRDEPLNNSLQVDRSTPYFDPKTLLKLLAELDLADNWESSRIAYTLDGLARWLDRVDGLGGAG